MQPDIDNNWVSVIENQLPVNLKQPAAADLRSWALVLTARNIPHQLVPKNKPATLLVPRQHVDIATHEISLYIKENRQLPPRAEVLSLQSNTLTSIAILAIIGTFHNATYFQIAGFGHDPIDWLDLGSADSTKILSGEWWRIITALTLHADGQHLLGNLLIGGYFVTRLCQLTGSGLGWLIILISGSLGNLINAFIHGPGHHSVGASTAIFGAIAIAGAISSALSRQHKLRYALLPLAAACILLAFLGAGHEGGRTDIGAHLFGFASGIGLGCLAGLYLRRWGQPQNILNAALSACCIFITTGAWLAALL